MTITDLQTQKRNKNRVNVFINDEFAFGLSRIVAGWLQIGQTLSNEKIQKLRYEDEIEVGLQKALHFISFRPRSKYEVIKNLTKHGFEEASQEIIIEKLERGNFIDDENFIRLWVEDRSLYKPKGKIALFAELRQKGIPREIIEKQLLNLPEVQLAFNAGKSQLRKHSQLNKKDFQKKIYGFLARRGFHYGIISEVTPQLWEEIAPKIVNEA
jgi:regulatory protein